MPLKRFPLHTKRAEDIDKKKISVKFFMELIVIMMKTY